MDAPAPALPVGLDPLIAEAKERARRRRLRLLLIAVVAVAGGVAAAVTLVLSSNGRAAIFCPRLSGSWQARSVRHLGRIDLVLTNFRFGNVSDGDGLLDAHVAWPQRGTMIALQEWTAGRGRPSVVGRLAVRRSQFVSDGNVPRPITSRLVRFEGRDVLLWTEVASLTPSTIAAANRALAGVQKCST